MIRRFGSYRAVEEIGTGGAVSVYLGVHDELGREVAIKALKPTVSVESPFAEPIEREARILASIDHPSVVRLLDYVRTPSETYLVLEYVQGFSLDELTHRKLSFAPEPVAALGVAVARALAYVHRRGVVHKDIKPGNVLVTKEGHVKVIDFGIAQRERLAEGGSDGIGTGAFPSARTEPIGGSGTASYMSPEQILGDAVDGRSDVYSLGILLYELLAGARPFDKEDARGGAPRHRRDPAIPLSSRAPEVPERLERIVMCCLERAPADRFDSADELASELSSFLASQAVEATPRLVAHLLARARLLAVDPDEGFPPPVVLPPGGTVRRAALGFAALGTVAIIGGGLLHLREGDRNAAPAAATTPSDVALRRPGYLRVLVTPWAEVSVDGVFVDTTPFARSISLPAGAHYVTLSHPSAKTEHREVKIGPGTTQLLDVTMDVAGRPEGDVRDGG